MARSAYRPSRRGSSATGIVSGARGWAALIGIAVLGLSTAGSAQVVGNGCDPDELIPLYSPETLRLQFESDVRLGNRLFWPPVSSELARCATLGITEELQARLGLTLGGTYQDLFDRRLEVSFPTDGTIGSKELDDVRLFVQNAHPNPTAGNLDIRLNLSSRGGIYRWQPEASAATQVNDGIPTYLSTVDVEDMTVTLDGNRVYAAVNRIPVLRSDDGGNTWIDPLQGPRPFSGRPLHILVSAVDPDRVWVIGASAGLFRSDDGGATWQQDLGVDPNTRANYNFLDRRRVIPPGGTDPAWVIFAQTTESGLKYSVDDGVTFTSVPGVMIPTLREGSVIDCLTTVSGAGRTAVNDIEVSRVDPGRIYVALRDWGVYEIDFRGGFPEWIPRFSGLVTCLGDDPVGLPTGRRRTIFDIVVLEPVSTEDDLLFAISDRPEPRPVPPGGTEPTEFVAFRSEDGGRNWSPDALGWPASSPAAPLNINVAFAHPDEVNEPRTVIAAIRNQGLWQMRVSLDQPSSWERVTYADGSPVYNPRVRMALEVPGTGDVLLATTGAGAYRVGEPIDLDQAIILATPAGQRVIETGLSLNFDNPAVVRSGERFDLYTQSFQGYIVWRSRNDDPVTGEPLWEMIALYDVTNPESCSDDPCDGVAVQLVPGCFADKRANCFTVPPDPTRDEWSFYDRDVSAGFTYNYAVTTFDYGFNGDQAPEGSRAEMVFSPRSALESSPQCPPEFRELRGGENFNRVFFQVNTIPAQDLSRVFAVPNPFVRRAGWDTGDGNFIRFFNVTETSQVEIYTIAGDFVRRIDNVIFDDRETGLIEWDTRNEEGEEVASGVYIYRVFDANGGEEMNRLTLIR